MFYDYSASNHVINQYSGGPYDTTLSVFSNDVFVISYRDSTEQGRYKVYQANGMPLYDAAVFDANGAESLSSDSIDDYYFVTAYKDYNGRGVFQIRNRNHGVQFAQTSANEVTLFNNTNDTLELYLSAVE